VSAFQPPAVARPPRAYIARRVLLAAELIRILSGPETWTIETISRAFAAAGWPQSAVRRGIDRLVASGALQPFDAKHTQVPLRLTAGVAAAGIAPAVEALAAQPDPLVVTRSELTRRLMLHAFCVPDEHDLARLVRAVRDSGSATAVESRAVVAALDELVRSGQVRVRTIGRERFWRRTPPEAR